MECFILPVSQREITRGIDEQGASAMKRFKLRYLLLALPVSLALICAGLYAQFGSYAPAAPKDLSTGTPTPFRPATVTPFQVGPTGTPTATDTMLPPLPTVTPTPSGGAPAWAPFAGPMHPASTPIPTPAEEITQGGDTLNIALLGIDKSVTAGSYRTDAIMILSLDRDRKSAVLISFPRDLYVYIPVYGMQRINAAFLQGQELHYPGGRFGLFADTMKYNFGLRVDHYALMNFQGFKDMVDALDGIDVKASRPLTDFRLGYGNYTIPAGVTHMDGTTALWYSRARYTTSDFDRERRQQEVILAIAQRLMVLRAIANFPGFFNIFMKYFESDLTLDMLTPYLELAGSVSPSSLQRYRITAPDGCSNWTTPEGGMVLLPKYDAIRAMLEAALLG
jgi:polyisoprenyl-teichoic acid--peptidoglycan teichoic acid transferase